MKIQWLPFLLVICLFAVFCTSCGPPVTNIDVGCSTSELIDAISTANDSSTVTTTIHLFPNCTYEFNEIETFDTTNNPAGVALPEIVSTIMIDGQSATISRSSLAATPEFRLFLIGTNGDLSLNQVTLQGGFVNNSTGLGGAILNYGNLIINNSDILGNSAHRGGAIYNKGTFESLASNYNGNFSEQSGGAIENNNNATITSCAFHANESFYGGAFSNYGAYAIFVDCEFSDNLTPFTATKSSAGGAIFSNNYGLSGIDESDMYVFSSRFFNNQASNGGAIANKTSSTIEIRETTFEGNRAYAGGALLNEANMEIIRSSLIHNQAEDAGGAIYSGVSENSAGLRLFMSTVSANKLTGDDPQAAAGIFKFGNATILYSTITENFGGYGITMLDGYMKIENSIIANNPVQDCADSLATGILTNGQANLDSDFSCPGFTLHGDPMLEPIADNGGETWTHKPKVGSPAVNAATNFDYDIDQIFQPRPVGPANDLGSFELQTELSIMPSMVPEPQITPEYLDVFPEMPKFGWDWIFEGFICSDMGLTEFYMKTSAPAEEFHMMINEKNVACYQQSYDNERYWCHVEKQPLGWEVPAEVTFCVGNECTAIDRTTLSENRCTSPDAPSQPVSDACSTFTDQRNCIAAPDCSWNCSRTALGESCLCESN